MDIVLWQWHTYIPFLVVSYRCLKSNFSVLVCRNGTTGGVSDVEFGMVPEVKQKKFPTPTLLYYLISWPSVRRTLTLRKCHLVTFNCFPQK
jgi:hypothetical protein